MIKKIYPCPEECKTKNVVICEEEGCSGIFKSDSNLQLHLAKTHGKSELLQNKYVKQYHCPEIKCCYHKEKHIKNMKFLRQHYMKVHMKKEFTCGNCGKNFTVLKLLQNHFPFCGVKFCCCDCKVSYPTYESLQTHGRRKKHNILTKQEYTSKQVPSQKIVPAKKSEKHILPKSMTVIVISHSNKINSIKDQCCQTDGCNELNQNIKKLGKKSFQTQTSTKPLMVAVQTQTEVNTANVVEISKTQKNSDTQTVKFNELNNTLTNSSSTQTCSYSNLFVTPEKIPSTSTAHSTALIGDSVLNNGFEFYNCHMETQTDFMFDDVMFGSDYLMNNTYTQTCDDVLNQFNFNDIQTQTVFDDDMLRSVESQTFMSPRMQGSYGCKDMSHTETQTDEEFWQWLEEINS